MKLRRIAQFPRKEVFANVERQHGPGRKQTCRTECYFNGMVETMDNEKSYRNQAIALIEGVLSVMEMFHHSLIGSVVRPIFRAGR